ncbi:MAG: helix-turn-helix domain-containing protein [Thermoplasmata archaeon]|jgi:HTH-type transcriptional regulator, sugar sensing transcriptional regulator
MDRKELIQALVRFGLNDREAQLYLVLVQRGPSTAPEAAREAGSDRVVAYRTLDALRARGRVTVTAERPRRYVPVPPRALFDEHIAGRRTAVVEDEKLASLLTELLPAHPGTEQRGAPRFQVLPGAPGIYPLLREMVKRAHTSLSVMITHGGLRRSVEYGIQQEIPRFLRGGGHVRMIVESDPRVRQVLLGFTRSQRRFPNLEIRQLYPQSARMTIVDDREVLVFPVPNGQARGVQEVAIWTDNVDFIRSQALHFDGMWERAGPATWRIPRASASRRSGPSDRGSSRTTPNPGRAGGAARLPRSPSL